MLDARSKGVNFRIMVKASYEIANYVKDPTPDHIVPTMGDWELYPRVASSVAVATVEEKLARKVDSKEGYYRTASEIIRVNSENFEKMMKMNIVEQLPEVNK